MRSPVPALLPLHLSPFQWLSQDHNPAGRSSLSPPGAVRVPFSSVPQWSFLSLWPPIPGLAGFTGIGLPSQGGFGFFCFGKPLCSRDSVWSQCGLRPHPAARRAPARALALRVASRGPEGPRSTALSLPFSFCRSFSGSDAGPARLPSSQGAPSFVPAPGGGQRRMGPPAPSVESAPGSPRRAGLPGLSL